MNQNLINIVDDILKIGSYLYKDSEFYKTYSSLYNENKEDLIKTFQYYLDKTIKDFNGKVIDVELIDRFDLVRVALTIDYNRGQGLILLPDLEIEPIEIGAIDE